jgi:hypothetical protein
MGSSNPFNAKISFEAYLHIPVYKDEEGTRKKKPLNAISDAQI